MTTTKTESRIRRFAAITAMVLTLAALTMMGWLLVKYEFANISRRLTWKASN